MMKTTRIAVAALALVAAAGLTACANDKSQGEGTKMEASAPINKKCPIAGGEANAKVTSVHEGKTVAFCCPGCKGKFDAMSDSQQDEIVAKAK